MKRTLAPCLVLLFLAALLTACGPETEGPPLNQKHEVGQADIALAKQLLADKNLEATDRIVAAVANDMQRLENSFWRESVAIEELQAFDILYSITYDAADVKDLIRVTEDGSGPINVTIRCGDRKDVWVYRSSGQIVFNRLSSWTRCKDTEGGGAVLRTIPAASLSQTPQGDDDRMTDTHYHYAGGEGLLVPSILMPKDQTTLSSRVNALAVHVAESLTGTVDGASGAELAAAVGGALAENREAIGQILADSVDGPSYKLYEYRSDSAAAYVVDTYENPDFSGAHYVWGILAEHKQ